MDRIVDITSDGMHVSVFRGFLTVSRDCEEQGRVALDDIAAVVCHAHGLTWTNNVFVKLSERKVPVIICGTNHAPVACVWPLQGHHAQGARMRAQAHAGKPLKKRLWQKIVAAKIRMQGHVVSCNGHEGSGFDMLARKVRSGDPDNVEAQAARRYWRQLFGSKFRRDVDKSGTNALLNYGYTVLRAIVSRSICASGLHPTLGIHHSNRGNSFALSDDLMEPYRPLVDQIVMNLIGSEIMDVSREAKFSLTSITTFDLRCSGETSPLTVQLQRFVHSVATSLEKGRVELDLPDLPEPLSLATLGTNSSRNSE